MNMNAIVFQPQSRAPKELLSHAAHLPVTRASFNHLHDNLALQWLQAGLAGGRVADAFHALCLANSLWIELHGEPSGVSFYNMACCLSVAADGPESQVLDAILGPVAAAEGNPHQSRCEQ